MLTYLLTKEDLTPEEVNGHVIDVVANGVDQVSVEKRCIIIIYYLMNGVVNQYQTTSDHLPDHRHLLSLLSSSLLPFVLHIRGTQRPFSGK